MIIVGAKGFAKELLEVLYQLNRTDNIVFFDDLSSDIPNVICNKFPLIRDFSSVQNHFSLIDNKFTLGLGNPFLRKKMYEKFLNFGGEFSSTISPYARISNFETSVQNGCNILPGAIISSNVQIKKGTIVYFNSIITHDSSIGEFVQISPGVSILGRVSIGDLTMVGSNVVILPDLKIGRNVIIGAGSVVTKDLPDNCIAYGVPAIIHRYNKVVEI